MIDGKRIAIVIAARMGSTRLPGKCMLELGGRSIIEQLILRMKGAAVDEVVLATTTNDEDGIFDEICANNSVRVFHGSQDDVLDRYVQAAKMVKADVIVRVTGDNPFTDPIWVDRAVQEHNENEAVLTTTREVTPEGKIISHLPKGLSIDVIDAAILAKVNGQSDPTAAEREHVIPYFFGKEFKIHFLEIPEKYKKDICLTIDTEEDLALARKIAGALTKPFEEATLDDIFEILDAHPDWAGINETVERKGAR